MRSLLFGALVGALALAALSCQPIPNPGEKSPEPKVENKKPAIKPCEPQDTIPVKPEAPPETVELQQILIAYRGSAANIASAKRSKAEAAKLCDDVLAKARSCADFNKLVYEYSDDPNKANDAKYNAYPGFYEITPQGVFDPKFKNCAMGMSPGNVDKVETSFGFHIIRRKS
jgi:parvulin-like peptidyl-prolyl isomerase